MAVTDTVIQKIRADGFQLTVTEAGKLSLSPASQLTDIQRAFIRKHREELRRALREEQAEDVSEYLIERSALAEYEGGLTRQEADRLAIQRAIIKFKLKDGQGGGTYISQATSIEEAMQWLREFYGERLESAKHYGFKDLPCSGALAALIGAGVVLKTFLA